MAVTGLNITGFKQSNRNVDCRPYTCHNAITAGTFVQYYAAGTVQAPTGTGAAGMIGVALEGGADGDVITVQIAGIAPVIANEALVEGDLVATTVTTGYASKLAPTSSDIYIAGRVIITNSPSTVAQGDFVGVLLGMGYSHT